MVFTLSSKHIPTFIKEAGMDISIVQVFLELVVFFVNFAALSAQSWNLNVRSI